MKKISVFLSLLFILSFFTSIPYAKAEICSTYVTGVGCPHCANTDPVVLVDAIRAHPELVIIEYEVYQESVNANHLSLYCDQYNLPSCYPGGPMPCCGIPMVIFSEDGLLVGDSHIVSNIDSTLDSLDYSPCPILEGEPQNFSSLEINSLPGSPKIWYGDKILIKDTSSGVWRLQWNGDSLTKSGNIGVEPDDDSLRELILTDNLNSLLDSLNLSFAEVTPVGVPISGQQIYFDHAIELKASGNSVLSSELTLAKIISLAIIDSVNPCALAVLALMLVAIITYNPDNKTNILLAGATFVIAVFSMYMIYGLIIIKFFQIVQMLTSVRLIIYQLLGVAAIILGVLNLKDFISYKPGGFGTEMPMSLRPKVKKLLSKVTSPKGAFGVGLFVTLFLLPCTIGPYVITGGILAPLELLATVPWLVLYNLLFVLPMVIVVLLVYCGIAQVEDVSSWKDKNIKYLHLVAGLIMTGLGIAMVLGLV